MSDIRPVERQDLPQIADLYERTVRSGGVPPPALAPYFERTLLDHPWADSEIPSLVYETEDGRILGFIGSHVRRLVLDGRQIRMGCAGQLISDPAQRRLAIGARLLRKYLSGPQDLTITDGATPDVHEMWLGLGGHALQPGSIVWIRLLQPWRVAARRWLDRRGRGRWRRIAGRAGSLLDAPTSRLIRPSAPEASVQAEELTARALIEHQDEIAGDARLRVDYDEAFVEWLFRELAAVRTRGRLVRQLLRCDGRLLGWYIAYMKRGGVSEVMEIAATKGSLEDVLDRLLLDAWRSGASAVQGRLEPSLYEPIARRPCLLRYGERALFHSRDVEVTTAISLGRSALTRLDGEWWMGHHTEPFGERRRRARRWPSR